MAFATPIGSFSVIQMRENPTWYVPQSIQEEWARAGKVVKKTVPPGSTICSEATELD
ncbi:MAG TPA: L,D-transpeptidase [Candidatus Binataceae bacterium]|nr:L,D-transpeptidase [Candidatus Binataceae bacterium]